MNELKEKFKENIDREISLLKKIRVAHKDEEIGTVVLDNLFRGMRGIPASYTPTSHVDAQQGIIYRGRNLFDAYTYLSGSHEARAPSAEATLWYLLTGEAPTASQIEAMRINMHARTYVPHHVFDAINALPSRTRPMTRFCVAILAWTTHSSFQDEYDKGSLSRSEHWSFAFEDALNLISGLPQVVSYIYRRYCKQQDIIGPDSSLDWTDNLSHMMGFEDTNTADLIRLFIFTHADHGGSNVSAHTAHTVGSALANAYYTFAASMLGLAGPLHGHANQQTVLWLHRLMDNAEQKGATLDEAFITKYIHNTLEAGQVIPGYGHAALRVEDPRFTMFYDKILKKNLDKPMLQLVDYVYKILPPILASTGKVADPHPNIDAISGACLYSYGIQEFNFYTIFFGVSRLIGISAQHIIDKAMGLPIFRPQTLSLDMLVKKYGEQ